MEKILKKIAKVFLGKGFIDKFAPFLIPVFERFYIASQKSEAKIVKIPNGKLKVTTKDTSVSLSLLAKGSYEPKETELVLKKLKRGDVFFDIGANIGYYTVLASKKVGPRGRVFAFEPDFENFKQLSENVKLNKCKNVVLENKAVSDRNGRIKFKIEHLKKGESRASKNGQISVPTIKLDNYGKIDVLKMDIEGAEIMALRGAKKTLNRRGIKLFIEYNPGSLEEFARGPNELLRLIRQLGFGLISIVDETRGQILPYSEMNLKSVMNHTTFCNLYCES